MTWEEIVRLYRLTIQKPPHNLPPRYNICPTDPVDVVTEREGSRDFVRMRWALVPSWWPSAIATSSEDISSTLIVYQPAKCLVAR